MLGAKFQVWDLRQPDRVQRNGDGAGVFGGTADVEISEEGPLCLD